MFWGEFSHLLDDKGRLTIPARYRAYLKQGAMLTRGLDRNLVIYPNDAWRVVAERLNTVSIDQPTARALRRLVFSGAVELSLDRQGRVCIPPYLREYASIHNEVLLAGMEHFIELWNPLRWHTTLNDVSGNLTGAEHLALFKV